MPQLRDFAKRLILNFLVLKLPIKDLERKIDSLEAKFVVMSANDQVRYKKYREEFELSKTEHEEKVDQIISLGAGFQILFLETCLFCFFGIILGGFEDYLPSKNCVVKAVSYLNLLYFIFTFFIVILNKTSGKGYAWLLFAFTLFNIIDVCWYIFHPKEIVNPNTFVILSDGALLTTCIFLTIPASTFIIFYTRRFIQANKAQKEIDLFVRDQENIFKGFTSYIGVEPSGSIIEVTL